MSIDQHDQREIHCRSLGHTVTFGYCRRTGDNTLCRRLLECWQTHFDVAAYVNAHCTTEQINMLTQPASSKICTLLELIERAQQESSH